jgi:hypothetical protein
MRDTSGREPVRTSDASRHLRHLLSPFAVILYLPVDVNELLLAQPDMKHGRSDQTDWQDAAPPALATSHEKTIL